MKFSILTLDVSTQCTTTTAKATEAYVACVHISLHIKKCQIFSVLFYFCPLYNAMTNPVDTTVDKKALMVCLGFEPGAT